jgi:hypothetical protein
LVSISLSAYIWAQGGAIWRQQPHKFFLDAQAAEFRLPVTDGKAYALDDVADEKDRSSSSSAAVAPDVKAVIDRMVGRRLLISEGVGFAAILFERCGELSRRLF